MSSTPCSPKASGQSPYQDNVKPEQKDPLKERTELHGRLGQVLCHDEGNILQTSFPPCVFPVAMSQMKPLLSASLCKGEECW